jgi:hypothetical protein
MKTLDDAPAQPLRKFAALDVETMTRAAEIWKEQDDSLPFHRRVSLDQAAILAQGGTLDAAPAPRKTRSLDAAEGARVALDREVQTYAHQNQISYLDALSTLAAGTVAGI